MNIGIFTDTYYPEVNGVANSAYQLKGELESEGNTVYVFTVSNPEMKEMEYNVFRLRSVPFALLKERRVTYSLTKIWINKVKELHLDVIHTQTEFGVGHLGRKLAEQLGIPHVHTYHTIYEDYTHYLRIPGNQKLKGIARTFSRSCCEKADLIIAPTEKVKRLLSSYGVKKEIIIQPTGVNISKFDRYDEDEVLRLRIKYHLSGSDHILLSVGRVSREKNQIELIEKMVRLKKTDPMAKLLIVGNGPELEFLRHRACEEGIADRVVFTGEVAWNGVENYYALGDAFVCASSSETQGLTYIESLAAGKPILARKDECLEGILQEGINGYGYSTDCDFLESYQKLFSDMKCREMKEICKESIQRISLQNFAQTLERTYHKVCWAHAVEEGEVYEKAHQLAG
ncbi:glycosyltransferase [Parasporobacterium paucivorans]|uniref:1,2-diacylglycerol 3-alpha-glucosyltransferase n=1 Tax=Parasporobacterium paucivorans DSM 15970 TaxID=1122934 RepID=A0A1M6IZ12_9FIRM|nr:glycosyltransferase [Parasporobacterium paucivorans]SHJ39701.1 1,2-diacylglycerol 3-alpha-glucosyltransferase [Parasporobacterium paucivorans DSM 15970]